MLDKKLERQDKRNGEIILILNAFEIKVGVSGELTGLSCCCKSSRVRAFFYLKLIPMIIHKQKYWITKFPLWCWEWLAVHEIGPKMWLPHKFVSFINRFTINHQIWSVFNFSFPHFLFLPFTSLIYNYWLWETSFLSAERMSIPIALNFTTETNMLESRDDN